MAVFGRAALLTCVVLAGFAAAPAHAADYKIVYSFQGGPNDGRAPFAGLTDFAGTLYGTTTYGGTSSENGGQNCNSNVYGCGTVFSVTPSGTETVLHSFQGGSDGAWPEAALTRMGAGLYGTTLWGGGNSYPCDFGCGTVFSVMPAGTVDVLYPFLDPFTGPALPASSLIDVGGTLYGTSISGGTNGGEGTVFALTASGTVNVLHGFAGGDDASDLQGALTTLNNVLYGTSMTGGGNGCRYYQTGCGTVFSMTMSGDAAILYRFQGGADGANPAAALTVAGSAAHPIFYGTTEQGGGSTACQNGCGTIFSLTPSGEETVVYRFQGGADGAYPSGSLIEVSGAFYGLTSGGGAHGQGTVFRVTASGAETVLHSFGANADGSDPRGTLVKLDGRLFGTTSGGGSNGAGTVFSIRPRGGF